MPVVKNFFNELKARNVRKTLAIYVSSALTTIGIVRLFTDVYGLPPRIFPVVVTLATCGLASAFLVAWYHGKEGAQKVRVREIVMHSVIGVVALVVSLNVGSATRRAKLPPKERTIAVLPFKNFSDSKEDEFFSDGVMEDILTQLSKIGDLNVISRTSAMKYKDLQKSIPEIAEELDAGVVLEGSVRRTGNRVRIVAQLIDAQSDQHLWSETYDRELKDIFSIQSEVAQKIAASLQATLSPQELRLIQTTPTTNLEAYALYLKGREHYYRYRKDDNEIAVDYFRKAIGLDPRYALAYAGLADAYSQRVHKFEYPKTWIDSALAASLTAIELDPNLAEGYKALGLAYDAKAWQEKALEAYKTALRLNPNYASVITNLADIYKRRGNLDTAISLLNKAVTLAPERPYIHVTIALVYQILELDSAAFRAYRRAIALDPNQQYAYMQLGWLHLTRGELSQARALRDTLLRRTPDTHLVLDYLAEVETFSGNYAKAAAYYDTLYSQGMAESAFQLAFALQKLGERRKATQLLEADLKRLLAEVAEKGDEMPALGVVYVYSMLGNLQEANRWLSKAIARGWRDYRWLVVDPRLENLHADAGFQSLIAELKVRVQLMRERVLQEGIVF